MEKDTKKSVILLVAVVVLAIIIYTAFNADDRDIARIGVALCHSRNLEFHYAKGETVRCYVLDNETGIKHSFEYWIDIERAKEIYLGGDVK